MTTSQSSLGATGYLAAAVDEPGHGRFGFLAAVGHGREAGHDLVVATRRRVREDTPPLSPHMIGRLETRSPTLQ